MPEHHGHHQRPRPLWVVDGDSMHLTHGLGEEGRGLEEAGRFDSGQGKRDPGSNAGYQGRRADGRAPGRHSGEVAPFQDLHEFHGPGVG